MGDGPPATRSSEEPIIEGGEVIGVDASKYDVNLIKKHEVTTARVLAYMLVVTLFLSVALHYALTVWLLLNEKTAIVEVTSNIFTTWLPVISGLAGSAVTYFLTKEK
jgi:hypothetical protein